MALGRKKPTAWGDVRASHAKQYGGTACSRCPAKRDTTGRYCKACRRAYNALRRAAFRAMGLNAHGKPRKTNSRSVW